MVSSKIMATMALLSAASALPSLISRQDCPAWECEQDAQAVPACALDCINDVAPTFNCGQNDYNCACENFAAIRAAAAECVITSCGIDAVGDVLGGLQTLCTCVSANPFEPCTPNTDPVDPPASATGAPAGTASVPVVAPSVTGYPVESVTKEVPAKSTTCTDDKEVYVPEKPTSAPYVPAPVPTGGYPGAEKPTTDKEVYVPEESTAAPYVPAPVPTGGYPGADKPTGDKPVYGTGVVPVPAPSGGYPSYPGANATVPAMPVTPKPTGEGEYPVTAGVAAKEVTVLGALLAGFVAVVAAL